MNPILTPKNSRPARGTSPRAGLHAFPTEARLAHGYRSDRRGGDAAFPDTGNPDDPREEQPGVHSPGVRMHRKRERMWRDCERLPQAHAHRSGPRVTHGDDHHAGNRRDRYAQALHVHTGLRGYGYADREWNDSSKRSSRGNE